MEPVPIGQGGPLLTTSFMDAASRAATNSLMIAVCAELAPPSMTPRGMTGSGATGDVAVPAPRPTMAVTALGVRTILEEAAGRAAS